MSECQVCTGRSELFLCGVCQRELRDMLTGLAVGQQLPNGHRAAGFIEHLQDAAWGQTRLGESARRSTEKGSPMMHNEHASELLNNTHAMLIRWVETVNLRTETLGL